MVLLFILHIVPFNASSSLFRGVVRRYGLLLPQSSTAHGQSCTLPLKGQRATSSSTSALRSHSQPKLGHFKRRKMSCGGGSSCRYRGVRVPPIQVPGVTAQQTTRTSNAVRHTPRTLRLTAGFPYVTSKSQSARCESMKPRESRSYIHGRRGV